MTQPVKEQSTFRDCGRKLHCGLVKILRLVFKLLRSWKFSSRANPYQDTGFIPPMLSVPSSSSLGEQCGKVTSLIREKIYFLADQLQCGAYKEGDPEIMEARARIQSMAAGLPWRKRFFRAGNRIRFTFISRCAIWPEISLVSR